MDMSYMFLIPDSVMERKILITIRVRVHIYWSLGEVGLPDFFSTDFIKPKHWGS